MKTPVASGSSRFKSVASLQFRVRARNFFSFYKIHHATSTLRSFLLPFPQVYFIARNIRFHRHLVQTWETLAPRYKRRHLLLFHVPLTLVPWNFLLPSRAKFLGRAVYVVAASSGLREIINIRSYERARSCEENSVDTRRRVQPVTKVLLFLAAASKRMTYAFDHERRNGDIFLQWFEILKHSLQNLVLCKNGKKNIHTYIRYIYLICSFVYLAYL